MAIAARTQSCGIARGYSLTVHVKVVYCKRAISAIAHAGGLIQIADVVLGKLVHLRMILGAYVLIDHSSGAMQAIPCEADNVQVTCNRFTADACVS